MCEISLQELRLGFDELNKIEEQGAVPCSFDYNNEKNPCRNRWCLEDESDIRCVWYTLDYCVHYDDRGCVIMLPHMMNKLASSDYKEIQQMPSEF